MASVTLFLDFMVGIADEDYAHAATARAIEALAGARRREASVIFSRIAFRPGHPEVSPCNGRSAR